MTALVIIQKRPYNVDITLDSAITQAFQDVVLDSVDKYRFVVLSDNNLNVSNEVLSHNWNNSDLIFVNLGDDPFRSQIVDLATATGGTTYDAISANDLTYESGELIYTPEQFIGTDSDGDGIPDLVELYGLKPNGTPLATDPNNVDTDDDGINDNVEFKYLGKQQVTVFTLEEYLASVYTANILKYLIEYYCSAIFIRRRYFTEGPGRPESPVDSAESKPLQY